MNTKDLLKKIISRLKIEKKKNLILVIILSFFSSLTESISLAILIPFVGFFLDPNAYLFSNFVTEIFSFFHIKTESEILTFATILFTIAILVSAFVKINYIKTKNN